MNRFGSLSRILAMSLCLGLVVTAVACSDDDSSNKNNNNNGNGNGNGNGDGTGNGDGDGTGDGNGDGDGDGNGTNGGKCQLQPGEYTLTTTKDPSSSAQCPEGQTTTFTMNDKTDGGSSTDTDAGENPCTTEVNEANCSAKTTCHVEQSGVVSDTTSETTVASDGQSYSGTTTTTTTVSGTEITCKYTVEAKKK